MESEDVESWEEIEKRWEPTGLLEGLPERFRRPMITALNGQLVLQSNLDSDLYRDVRVPPEGGLLPDFPSPA